MAEIGIAASIISVAAFGVSVATTLYETADIMIHASPQIRALAKHVTQFTAVLNHMGQMLETEKINCSKEVLRDIQKIKRSCKRTFREIRATVRAQRFRRLMWLFKRTKAMELEARLDSQQSMLQCMRNLEERSRTLIHERGLNVAINDALIGMRYEHYNPPGPPRPGDGNFNTREYFGDENLYREAPLPYLHTPEDSFTSRRAKSIYIPPLVEVGGPEKDTTRRTRSEVRFTLPRMQPADIAKEAQTKSAKTNVPISKTDDELRSLRQRLERAKKRKEEAEKAKDIHTVFDLTTYAIPELEAKLEKVLEQRKAEEKSTGPVSHNQEDWRSHRNGVEMESEDDDDEGESEAEAEDE